MGNMPDDILIDILSRLPTKPLLRCRCVSKHWNRLISDPNFFESRSHRMVIFSVFPLQSMQVDDTNNSMIKLRCPLGHLRNKIITVVGTFEGIVLLVIESSLVPHMMLYNPLTRAYKVIPNPITKSSHYFANAYGFGYGSTLDDLEIVLIQADKRSRVNPHSGYETCVFSFKNNLWIKAQGLSDLFTFLEVVGTFTNGFLHWIAFNPVVMILAFNMKDLVYSEIYLPLKCGKPTDPLGIVDGSLCVLCYNDDTNIDVWVMKEYGNSDSWSRICSITFFYIGYNSFHRLYPMCILKNKKIVMMNNSKIIFIYDMENGSYKKLNALPGLGTTSKTFRCIEYMETLASPSALCSI